MVQVVIPLEPVGLELRVADIPPLYRTADEAAASDGTKSSEASAITFVDPEHLVIVELQGSLETTGGGGGLEGATLGELDYTAAGTPLLRIGHHLLRGKVVNLDRPLAVLRAVSPPTGIDGSGVGGGQLDDEDGAGPSPRKKRPLDIEGLDARPRYDVVALVRRKLLFDSRPEPIVDAAAAKSR